jgi:hypothetical protein
MRRRSVAACGDRASAGRANEAVAASRHCVSSLGKIPCSRHHAFFCASLRPAVASTASKRATAVQPPLFTPDASASDRQRSSVSAPTPISRDTV